MASPDTVLPAATSPFTTSCAALFATLRSGAAASPAVALPAAALPYTTSCAALSAKAASSVNTTPSAMALSADALIAVVASPQHRVLHQCHIVRRGVVRCCLDRCRRLTRHHGLVRRLRHRFTL